MTAFPSIVDLHRVESVGTEELARSITGWSQVYDQTTPGHFTGALTEMLLGRAQLFVETSSHALVQSCKSWPDSVWFGIPAAGRRVSRIDGAPIEQDMLAVHTGDCDFILTTPDDFSFLGVVVDVQTLCSCVHDGDREAMDFIAQQRVLRVSQQSLERLRNWLQRTLVEATGRSSGAMTVAVHNRILDDLLEHLSVVVRGAQRPARERVSTQASRRAVERAREYVRAQAGRQVTVLELCDQVGLGRRALQDSFQRSLGLSPKAYLHTTALNAARREFSRPDSPLRTVGDVAASFGFWHLSQFALDYRRLFNELPSETLRRRANHAEFR